MRPEFTDPCVIGPHFGGMIARHGYEFTACQNVELIRMKHQPAGNEIGLCQPFPERVHLAACRRVYIDQSGMFAGTPSYNPVFPCRREIDTERDAVTDVDIIGAAHKPDITLKVLHGVIRHRGRSTPQAKL